MSQKTVAFTGREKYIAETGTETFTMWSVHSEGVKMINNMLQHNWHVYTVQFQYRILIFREL